MPGRWSLARAWSVVASRTQTARTTISTSVDYDDDDDDDEDDDDDDDDMFTVKR